MVASSSVLNAPNCSVPCTSGLNRATCEVAEDVRVCAEGFVGVLGPSNEPCYVAGEHCNNGVLDGNETDTDCGGPCAPCKSAGAACVLDTDCLYSWCTALRVCAVPVKICPGSNCTIRAGRVLVRRCDGRDARIARLLGKRLGVQRDLHVPRAA